MKKHSFIGKALVIAFISLVAVSAAEAKGRKYGLFIGINAYTGGISPLKGCVNDATKMREAMTTKFGFNTADTTLLTDAAATREGIIGNIKKYEALAGAGDIFVLHYSGHGTLFPDRFSEEQDESKLIYMELPNNAGQMEVLYPRATYDSAWVPYDANARTSGKPWRNLILDDELYAMLGAITRKGAQVVLISDSCHSGSIDKSKKNEEAVPRAESLATVFGARRFSELEIEAPATKSTTRTPPPASPLYLSMTGSKDEEFSLDVNFAGMPMGLFTNFFLEEVRKIPTVPGKPITVNYQQIMTTVTANVTRRATGWGKNQTPQLNFAYGNPRMALFSVPK